MKAYANCIQPMLNMKMWPQSNNPPIEPPEVKILPGRPKKNRRKSKDEPKKIGKYSRKGTLMTCSFCKKEGHNKKSCQQRKEAGTEGSSSHAARVSTRPAKLPITRPTLTSTQRNNSEKSVNANKQAAYKRPRLSGYGVVISERTGFTTELFGTLGGRVVTTGARNIKNSADVTGDNGFQPQKLKFFGKKSMTPQQLQQELANRQRVTSSQPEVSERRPATHSTDKTNSQPTVVRWFNK
ncbi:uncharacterized protein [Euphorbia lathyris]|uniref:uncharacterized protein n=1 Tax=Euphorbia lathyris TaxID=212925 RepID=UPI0033140873